MDKNDNLISANLAEMARALSKATPELIEDFLHSLLTPSEVDEIAKRWALVKEIALGRPQRDIAKALGLSLCKITRGSRELKKEESSFRRMLGLAGLDIQAPAASPAPQPRAESQANSQSFARMPPAVASEESRPVVMHL